MGRRNIAHNALAKSGGMEIKTRLQTLLEMIREDPKRLGCFLVVAFLLFWILRGCIPGNGLPGDVAEAVDHRYITCINPNDTPVQPGVDRQPECGKVYVEMVKKGTVPVPDQTAGVTRAICYRITVEYPRWETAGQTRHEVLWSSRSYSKVAIQQNGKWQTFPDEDKKDEERWQVYGCPGKYASE
jgi:hypothetical protein